MTLSAEEVARRLRLAAEAVEKADLAEDLRQIAFERSLDVVGLAAPQRVAAEAGASGAPGSAVDEHQPATPRSGADPGPLAQLAAALGLDADAVGHVYEEDDGQVRLSLRRAMLPDPDKKAAAMRDVALLVVAGRQAAGVEDYTPFSVIREECRDLKVLDSPNFSTEVGKFEFRLRGGRNNKEAKANRHHLEEAAQLIKRMTQRTDS
jgi:hypothetical protein